jgi:hypothetical protein
MRESRMLYMRLTLKFCCNSLLPGKINNHAQLPHAYANCPYIVSRPTKYHQCIRLWYERGSERPRERIELLRRRMYV